MTYRLLRRLFLIVLILVTVSPSSLAARYEHWREIRGRPLTKFDWNCASTSGYPKAKLRGLVEAAMKREDAAGEKVPDLAFAFDLNNDGTPEYFVPLVCGATGNCTWGIFALRPARFLGTVNGQYIYLHKRSGGWPGVITYGHLSVQEGVLDTYLFRNGRYALLGNGFPVGPEDRTLEIQNIPGRKMPRFLDRARIACKDLGG